MILCVVINHTNGNIIVSGGFTDFSGNACNYIAELDSSGNFIPTFTSNGGSGFDNLPIALAIQPNGQIVVGGLFTIFNGVSCNFLTRLNSDGSLDLAFANTLGATGFDGPVTDILLQADGKILVGGFFSSFNGNTDYYIARLNNDGTLDSSFHTGVDFNAPVLSLAQQSTGKLIVGGIFTLFDTTPVGYIARLFD